MAALEARGLTKRYTAGAGVYDFTHAFADGKVTAIVGPSGSGKSTTLWMLAGLTAPDEGAVIVDGADVTRVPSERRNAGVVFQQYALFPHLSVRENVEFGLRVRGASQAERRHRAEEVLALTKAAHLGGRAVGRLSGGEQQRVALARALAFHPRFLLLDEPLSALDAQLREELREELATLLRSLAVTTVYVTHDQTEALAIADDLLVLRAGRIEQAGVPDGVYRAPASASVARFLGAANVLSAQCVQRAGVPYVDMGFVLFAAPSLALPVGRCEVMVRPEDLTTTADAPEHWPRFEARVVLTQFLGNRTRITLDANGVRLLWDHPGPAPALGARVTLAIAVERVVAWPLVPLAFVDRS